MIFADMTFDQWMDFCAMTGVALYLFAHWSLLRGWCDRKALWNRFLRFISLAMLLAPLALRWYLSNNMIMALGVLMAAGGLWNMLRIRR